MSLAPRENVCEISLAPHAALGDVIVDVYASGFTPDELTWPGAWVDRQGRDRTPTIPGQELAGVVTSPGYGTTGLSVGQRVFRLSDGHRTGTLAEQVAVEARNLAPLPASIDFLTAAALAMPGLTAWQGLFEHGRLQAGQSILIPGAAGAVGSMVTQLARSAGAYVIGAGRAGHRQAALDFVVVPDRAQLSAIAQRFIDGQLRPNINAVASLQDAVATFNSPKRPSGKTIIQIKS